MFNVAVIVVALATAHIVAARPADDHHHGCKTKENSFKECFIESGNHLFKMLHKGDKSLNLPVLDPLEVKKMTVFNLGQHMRLEMSDATHRGLGDAVISSADADPQHYTFMMNMTIPKYSIKGKYDMNAKIANLPMQGVGNADITLEDLQVWWDVKGKPVTRKGKQYMEITEFKANFAPKVMKIHLDNLFNGNKELGTTINTFLNENWEEVLKQLKPSMEKSWSQLMKAIGTKLLEKIPYKEMFPDM
ncbi:protein takeout-like [Macrosteles quadrilineatus]|uniref:protein takeout-like n=1 Tax=Macrosteles quadrilineatus TaxID=74068 RepID=UPI0023E1B7FB|nr:protein takeout-like [Macrosteles quadrilineatus]